MKAVVGATSVLKSFEGTVRGGPVASEMKKAPLSDLVVKEGGKFLGLDEKAAKESSTIFAAANAVHIAGFYELMREVGLMSMANIERIAAQMDTEAPVGPTIDNLTADIMEVYKVPADKKETIKEWLDFLGPNSSSEMMNKIGADPVYKDLIGQFIKELISSKGALETFTSSLDSDEFTDSPERFTRILIRESLTTEGDTGNVKVGAIRESIKNEAERVPAAERQNLQDGLFDQLEKEQDVASYLRSSVENGTIFRLIPEARDLYLLHIATTHDYNDMMAHVFRIIDKMQAIDDAATINADLEKAIAAKDVKLQTELKAGLAKARDRWVERSGGTLDSLTMDDFMRLVEFYQNIAEMNIEVRPEAGKRSSLKGRELMWLLAFLHDIGKTVSWPQHIHLSAVMLKDVMERFTFANGAKFDDKLIDIACALIENHSCVTRLSYGEEAYYGIETVMNDNAKDVTFTDPKGKSKDPAQTFINMVVFLNIADIRGVGLEGKFTPERLKEFIDMGKMTPEELKKKAEDPNLYYRGEDLPARMAEHKDFFDQLQTTIKSQFSKGMSIDRIGIREMLRANNIGYIEFLAEMMSRDEALAKNLIGNMGESEKRALLKDQDMGERLLRLVLRRDTMDSVTDAFERRVRLTSRLRHVRNMIEDGLSDTELTSFMDFMKRAKFSYMDAAASAMDKDESLAKLLVVLWKIWGTKTHDATGTGPMMYIAFETMERDPIKTKKAISLLEGALNKKVPMAGTPDKEVEKWTVQTLSSELDVTNADQLLSEIKLSYEMSADNEVVICKIDAEGRGTGGKKDKERPIAIDTERNTFDLAIKKIADNNSDNAAAIKNLERKGLLVIDDTKSDTGPQTIAEVEAKIVNAEDKSKERDRVVESLRNQGFVISDLKTDSEINAALEAARQCDTVAKDANNNIKIILRPLVLEDMPDYDAAAVIWNLYRIGNSMVKGDKPFNVRCSEIIDPTVQQNIVDALHIRGVDEARKQIAADEATIYSLRKEQKEHIDIWQTDWGKALAPINALTEAEVRTKIGESILDKSIDDLESYERALINDLWEKFLDLPDDASELDETGVPTKTIRESLKDALTVLYGKAPATDKELRDFVIGDLRSNIQKNFMDGEDIIKKQHRGVAERDEARKLLEEKKDLDKAKKMLLQTAGLEIESIRLGMTAMAMMAIGLAEENKTMEALKDDQLAYNKRYGVVPVIIAGGEGSRRSPDQQVNKSFDEILGTANVNKLYSAISFLSKGIRPVVPLGKNTLTYILNEEGYYNEAKTLLAEKGGSALDELLPRNVVSLIKKRVAVPDNAILIIKEEDEAGGHGANQNMAMEVYAKGDLEEPDAAKKALGVEIFDNEVNGKKDDAAKAAYVIDYIVKAKGNENAILNMAAALYCLKHGKIENVPAIKIEQILKKIDDDRGMKSYKGRLNQLIQYYEGRIEGARMQDVGLFQVHFGEHSPLALETMVHTGLVAFLKVVSERAIASGCSRQSLEIRTKGNFVFDSVGRSVMLGDYHKIMMIISPKRIMSGEIERRLEELEKSFHHQDMAKVKELVEALNKELVKVDDWGRVDKETKAKLAPMATEISKKLQAIFEAAIKAGVMTAPNIDKKGAAVESEIELLSYLQQLLSDKKDALIAEKGAKEAFMPINTNKTVFSKRLWDLARTTKDDGTVTSKLFDYPSSEDPAKFDIGFLAWEYLMVLNEVYRQTPPSERRKRFNTGGYPITFVDQGLVGFEPKSFERSGLKDIKTVVDSINDFVKLNNKRLKAAGVKMASDKEPFTFTYEDGHDVLSRENRKNLDKVFSGKDTTVAGVFYHDFHSTIESNKNNPVILTNVALRRSYVNPGSEITGKDINTVLTNTYLGSGKYNNLYARDTIIPEGRKLTPIADGIDYYEVVGMMSEELKLYEKMMSLPSDAGRMAFINELLAGRYDDMLNFREDAAGADKTAGRITSVAAVLWYMEDMKGVDITALRGQLPASVISVMASIRGRNENIRLAGQIVRLAADNERIEFIDSVLAGEYDAEFNIEKSYGRFMIEQRIRLIAEALWSMKSVGLENIDALLKTLVEDKESKFKALHKEVADATKEYEKMADWPIPVTDDKGNAIKIEGAVTNNSSDFVGKFNDIKPVDEKAEKIDKARYEELYSDPKKRKGGAVLDKNGEYFALTLTGQSDNLFDLVGSQNFKKEPCSDGTKLFGSLDMDVNSHIGNACYSWDNFLRHASVGDGWGLRGCKVRDTILEDHELKAKTHASDKGKFTMLLRADRNDGNMNAYTAAIKSDFNNSFIGVNSGWKLRGMNNRKALVGVKAMDTVIPEGREVKPGERITGLMAPEIALTNLIYRSSMDDAYWIIKNLLDENADARIDGDAELKLVRGEGRFTSAAVALLLNPEKAGAILGRMTNRERTDFTIEESPNKDAEYSARLSEKISLLAPLKTRIQLATKGRIAPETEIAPAMERGWAKEIPQDILKLAGLLPKLETGKKAEDKNPWEDKFQPISEWDKAFNAFAPEDPETEARLRSEGKEKVTVYIQLGKKQSESSKDYNYMKFNFWVPEYDRASQNPAVKNTIDLYAATFSYWLGVIFGARGIYIAGPRGLAEHVESKFKGGSKDWYERPDFRIVYGDFKVEWVGANEKGNERVEVLNGKVSETPPLPKDICLGIAMGTGYACGFSDPTGNVLPFYAEAGMAPIDMNQSAPGHRVSKLPGAQQMYGAQYALLRMAPEAGIEMERQTQLYMAVRLAKEFKIVDQLDNQPEDEWAGIVFRHMSDQLLDMAVDKNAKELAKKAEEKGEAFNKEKLLTSLIMRNMTNLSGKDPKEWTPIFVELFAKTGDIELPQVKDEAGKKEYLDAVMANLIKEVAKKFKFDLGDDRTQFMPKLLESLIKKHLEETEKLTPEQVDSAWKKIENDKIEDKLDVTLKYYKGKENELTLKMLRFLSDLSTFNEVMPNEGNRLKYVLGLVEQNVMKREWFKEYDSPENMQWAVRRLYEKALITKDSDYKKASMMYLQIGRYLAEGLARAYKMSGSMMKSVVLFGRMVNKGAGPIIIGEAKRSLEEDFGIKNLYIKRADDLAKEKYADKDKETKERQVDIVNEYGQAVGVGYATKAAADAENKPKIAAGGWERYVMLDLGGSDMKIVAMRVRCDDAGNIVEEQILYTHKHVWDPRNFKSASIHLGLMKQYIETAISESNKGGQDSSDKNLTWEGDPDFTKDNVRGIGISFAGPIVDGVIAGQKPRLATGLTTEEYRKNLITMREKIEKDSGKFTYIANDGDAGAVWGAAAVKMVNERAKVSAAPSILKKLFSPIARFIPAIGAVIAFFSMSSSMLAGEAGRAVIQAPARVQELSLLSQLMRLTSDHYVVTAILAALIALGAYKLLRKTILAPAVQAPVIEGVTSGIKRAADSNSPVTLIEGSSEEVSAYLEDMAANSTNHPAFVLNNKRARNLASAYNNAYSRAKDHFPNLKNQAEPKVKLVTGNPNLAFLEGDTIAIDYDSLLSKPLVTLEFYEEFRHYAHQADPRGPPTIEEKAFLELLTDYEKVTTFLVLPVSQQAEYVAAILKDPGVDTQEFYKVLVRSYTETDKFNQLLDSMRDGYGVPAERIDALRALQQSATTDIFELVLSYGQKSGVYEEAKRLCLATADGRVNITGFININTIILFENCLDFKEAFVNWLNKNHAVKNPVVDLLTTALDSKNPRVVDQAVDILGRIGIVPSPVVERLTDMLKDVVSADAASGVDEARSKAEAAEAKYLKQGQLLTDAMRKADDLRDAYRGRIDTANWDSLPDEAARLQQERDASLAELKEQLGIAKLEEEYKSSAIEFKNADNIRKDCEDKVRVEMDHAASLIDALKNIAAACIANIHARHEVRAAIQGRMREKVIVPAEEAGYYRDILLSPERSHLGKAGAEYLKRISIERFTAEFTDRANKDFKENTDLSENEELAIASAVRDILISIMHDSITLNKALNTAAEIVTSGTAVTLTPETIDAFVKAHKIYHAAMVGQIAEDKDRIPYHCAQRLLKDTLSQTAPSLISKYFSNNGTSPAEMFASEATLDADRVANMSVEEKIFVAAMVSAMKLNSSIEGFYWHRIRATNALNIFSSISDPDGIVVSALNNTAKYTRNPGDSGYVPVEQNFMTSPSSNPVLNLELSANLTQYEIIRQDARRDILGRVLRYDGAPVMVPDAIYIQSLIKDSAKPLAVVEACINILTEQDVPYTLKENIATAFGKVGYTAVSSLDVLIALYEDPKVYGTLKAAYASAIRDLCWVICNHHNLVDPASSLLSPAIRRELVVARDQASYDANKLRTLYLLTKGLLGKLDRLSSLKSVEDITRSAPSPEVFTLAGGNSTQALLQVLRLVNPSVWVQSLLSTDDDGGSTRNLKALFMKLFGVKFIAPGDIVNASLKVIPLWMKDSIDQRFSAEPEAERHYQGKYLFDILQHGDDFRHPAKPSKDAHIASLDEVRGSLDRLVNEGREIADASGKINTLAKEIEALSTPQMPVSRNTAYGIAAHLYTNFTHRNKWRGAKIIDISGTRDDITITLKKVEELQKLLRLAAELRAGGIFDEGAAMDMAAHMYTHISDLERAKLKASGVITVSEQGVISAPSQGNVQKAFESYKEFNEKFNKFKNGVLELAEAVDNMFVRSGHLNLYGNSLRNLILVGAMMKARAYDKDAINMSGVFAGVGTYRELLDIPVYAAPTSDSPNVLGAVFESGMSKIEQDMVSHTPNTEGNPLRRFYKNYQRVNLPPTPEILRLQSGAKLVLAGLSSFFTSFLVLLLDPSVSSAMANNKEGLRIFFMNPAHDEETVGLTFRELMESIEHFSGRKLEELFDVIVINDERQLSGLLLEKFRKGNYEGEIRPMEEDIEWLEEKGVKVIHDVQFIEARTKPARVAGKLDAVLEAKPSMLADIVKRASEITGKGAAVVNPQLQERAAAPMIPILGVTLVASLYALSAYLLVALIHSAGKVSGALSKDDKYRNASFIKQAAIFLVKLIPQWAYAIVHPVRTIKEIAISIMPRAPPIPSVVGPHRMHNGWLIDRLGLKGKTLSDNDQKILKAFNNIPEPAYFDTKDNGKIKIFTNVSSFLADVEGSNKNENNQQHKVHEVVEHGVVTTVSGEGILSSVIYNKLRTNLGDEFVNNCRMEMEKLYGIDGLDNENLQVAHLIAEWVDDKLFPNVGDHLPADGLVRYMAEEAVVVLYDTLKSMNEQELKKFAEGAIAAEDFEEYTDDTDRRRVRIKDSQLESVRDRVLATMLALNAENVPTITASSKFGKMCSEKNFRDIRYDVAIMFIKQGDPDKLRIAARIINGWAAEFGVNDAVAKFENATKELPLEKRMELIFEVGVFNAELADAMVDNFEEMKQGGSIIGGHLIGLINNFIEKDSWEDVRKLEVLGQVVRLLGRLSLNPQEAGKAISVLEKLYDNDRARPVMELLKELKKAGESKDAAKLNEFANIQRNIEVQQQLDTFVIQSLEAIADNYGSRKSESNYEAVRVRIQAVLEHIATDQRKYPGLYFVRQQAVFAMRVLGEVPAVSDFIESVIMEKKTSSDQGWAGYVPNEQHFGTSYSYSPVANLKYSCGMTAMAMNISKFKGELENIGQKIRSGQSGYQVSSERIADEWKTSKWPSAVMLAMVQTLSDTQDSVLKERVMRAFAIIGLPSMSITTNLYRICSDSQEDQNLRYAARETLLDLCETFYKRMVSGSSIATDVDLLIERLRNTEKSNQLSFKDLGSLKKCEYITKSLLSQVKVKFDDAGNPQYYFSENASDMMKFARPKMLGIGGGGGSSFLVELLKDSPINYWNLEGVVCTVGVDDDGGSTADIKGSGFAAFATTGERKTFGLPLVAIGDMGKAIETHPLVKEFLASRMQDAPEKYKKPDGSNLTLREYLEKEPLLNQLTGKLLTGDKDNPKRTIEEQGYLKRTPDEVAFLRNEILEAASAYDAMFIKSGYASLYRNSMQNMIMLGLMIKDGAFCFDVDEKTGDRKWFVNMYGLNQALINYTAIMNFKKVEDVKGYPIPVFSSPNVLVAHMSNGMRKITQDYFSHTRIGDGLRVERFGYLMPPMPANVSSEQAAKGVQIGIFAPTSPFTSMMTVMQGDMPRILSSRATDPKAQFALLWILPPNTDTEESVGMKLIDIMEEIIGARGRPGMGRLPNVIFYADSSGFANVADIKERANITGALYKGTCSGSLCLNDTDFNELKSELAKRHGINLVKISELEGRTLSAEDLRNTTIAVPMPAGDVLYSKQSRSRIDDSPYWEPRYKVEEVRKILDRVVKEELPRIYGQLPRREVPSFPVSAALKEGAAINAVAKISAYDGTLSIEGEGLSPAQTQRLEDAIAQYLESIAKPEDRSIVEKLLKTDGVKFEVAGDLAQIADQDEDKIEVHTDLLPETRQDNDAEEQLALGLSIILEHEFLHLIRWIGRGEERLVDADARLSEEYDAIMLMVERFRKAPDSQKETFKEFFATYLYGLGMDVSLILELLELVEDNVAVEYIKNVVFELAGNFSGVKWAPVEELDGRIIINKETGAIRFASEEPIITGRAELLAIRHGVTQANIDNRWQGVTDGADNQLTAEGRKEAVSVGNAVFNDYEEKIKEDRVVVVTSRLGRSKEIAGAFTSIVKNRTGKDITVVEEPLAVERSFGSWENRTAGEIPAAQRGLLELYNEGLNATVRPGETGESVLDLLIRAEKFLKHINNEYPGKTVICFGHGSFIKALMVLSGDRSLLDENGLIRWNVAVPHATPMVIFKPEQVDVMKALREACDIYSKKHDKDWADVVNAKDAYERIVLSGKSTEKAVTVNVIKGALQDAFKILVSNTVKAAIKDKDTSKVNIVSNINAEKGMFEIRMTYPGIGMNEEYSRRSPGADRQNIFKEGDFKTAWDLLSAQGIGLELKQYDNGYYGNQPIFVVSVPLPEELRVQKFSPVKTASAGIVIGIPMSVAAPDRKIQIYETLKGMGITNVSVQIVLSPDQIEAAPDQVVIFVNDDIKLESIRLESIKTIELIAKYNVILGMTNIDSSTREEIAGIIKELIGDAKSLSAAEIFGRAIIEVNNPDNSEKVKTLMPKLKALVDIQRRHMMEAARYNQDYLYEDIKADGKKVAHATTEQVAVQDMSFARNLERSNSLGVKNVFVYGEIFEREEQARAFLSASGYKGSLNDIVYVNRHDKSFDGVINEIQTKTGTDNIGIRPAEGEFKDLNSARAKILEVQTITIKGKRVLLTMNTYEALLKILKSEGTNAEISLALEGWLPGVVYDQERNIFKYLPRTVPVNYGEEMETYRNAVLLLSSAA
ncbi:MAG: histidine phosphatase family protein [Candidatus Omnitrophota bacterium]